MCVPAKHRNQKRGDTHFAATPTPFYQASKLKVFLLISSLLQYEVYKANICICQNELTNHTASCIVIKTMVLIKIKILLYYMKLTVSPWKGIKRFANNWETFFSNKIWVLVLPIFWPWILLYNTTGSNRYNVEMLHFSPRKLSFTLYNEPCFWQATM